MRSRVNLTNGFETVLGSWNSTFRTGFTASFGLWTVVERGGYLYLQSSDDGIQVYSMANPTNMGSLYESYSAELLNEVTRSTLLPPYYGFDVEPNGRNLLLGGYDGRVLELGSPNLTMSCSGTDTMLTWDASGPDVVVQSCYSLSPSSFWDIYPAVQVNGKLRTAIISASPDTAFFRLRRSW